MITNLKDIPKTCMGIYLLKYDNNKVYVGQAQNIKVRALEHNNKNYYPCDKALKKHNAVLIILEEVQDFSQLDNIEEKYIAKYDATNREKGYNILQNGNASGKRGIENCNAAFSQKELNEIVDLLINHKDLSYIDIANRFNVVPATILKISQGLTYYNPNLDYPLRSNDHTSAQKNDILDYFQSEEDLINLKEDLLYRWDLSIEIDLKNKYNIPLKILRAINKGEKFKEIGNYSYPIRDLNCKSRVYNFTQEDIIHILNDLRLTNNSMTAIGKKYGLGRATISKINCGQRYLIKDFNYPARQT